MRRLLIAALLFVLLLGHAQAGPVNGAGTDLNFTYGGTDPSLAIGVGLDYQFAVSDRWSAHPFWNLHTHFVATEDMRGVQLRYWDADRFMGMHWAKVDQYVLNVMGGNPGHRSGEAVGVLLGLENSKSYFTMFQLDRVRMQWMNAGVMDDLFYTEFRYLVGYRWK